MKFDICVIGLGYIGLPTATIFAANGLKVLGVDVRPDVVKTINQGKTHFEEPDLDGLVKQAVESGCLKAAAKAAPSGAFIIAVPTPHRVTPKNPRAPDLTFVEQATRSIAPFVAAGDLVILESTSPVGTTAMMCDWLADERRKLKLPLEDSDKILFAHCPERVLPGKIVKELVENDRLAGGLTPEAGTKAQALYKRFCKGEVIVTDAHTAELVKLAENSFRDVNIAYANELSMICDKLGINVWELIRLANRHPRVKILQPGPGVGGHCIAVDPWFIVDSAPKEARLIRTARIVNDSKPEFVLNKVKLACKKLKKPVIACLGLAFKANVDDLRESPAVEIVHKLSEMKLGNILVVEPHVKSLPKSLAGCKNLKLVSSATALKEAGVVVLLVDHDEFRGIPRSQLDGKAWIDTRGIWSAQS